MIRLMVDFKRIHFVANFKNLTKKSSPIYLSSSVRLLGGALGLARGIAEGEDHRPGVVARHLLEYRPGEGAADSRRANEDRGLGQTNNISESVHGSVVTSEGLLVLADAAGRTVLHDQAPRVDHPDFALGLLLRGAFFLHGHDAEPGDTQCRLLNIEK